MTRLADVKNSTSKKRLKDGTSAISSANREKLSLYYGIGPEYFYEKELDNIVKQMIRDSAEKARRIVSESNGKRNKEDDFSKSFDSISFADAMNRYMLSMKLLLAVSEKGELDKLETALLINKKIILLK